MVNFFGQKMKRTFYKIMFTVGLSVSLIGVYLYKEFYTIGYLILNFIGILIGLIFAIKLLKSYK